MKKMHKWMLGVVIGLVLLIGASIVTLYVGTNILMGTLLSSNMSNFDNLNEGLTSDDAYDRLSSDIEQKPSGTSPDAENDASEPLESIDIPAAPVDRAINDDKAEPSVRSDTAAPTADQTPSSESGQNDKSDETRTNDDARSDHEHSEHERTDSTREQATSDHEDDPFAYSAEITEDKQQAVKENITFGERMKLVTTLGRALDANEISKFMKMAQGGLTIEEKREAKKIMLEKLSQEEYDELIAIAAKYGLSEGKSYEEGLKETGVK